MWQLRAVPDLITDAFRNFNKFLRNERQKFLIKNFPVSHPHISVYVKKELFAVQVFYQ